MKKLLLIALFAFASIIVNAQSGTGKIDASGDVTITGGDGKGSITNVQWTVQGTPPGPVSLSAPNNLVTDITLTKVGDYKLLLTVKDNLGTTATGVYSVTASWSEQKIIIKVSIVPGITIK